MTDQLTVHFGERARVGDAFLADALADLFARHDLGTSIVMRAALGFGAKHGLRDDRLLTLSEDLPLVAVAVDEAPRIEAALAEVDGLDFTGLVTLEPVAPAPAGDAKLTVYVGRHDGLGDRAVVELLRGAGVAGATVVLGIDGTLAGVRRRARFFGRNTCVPTLVTAVAGGVEIAAALAALGDVPLATCAPALICKRDGELVAEPGTDGAWQRLTVYAGEQSRHRGQPLSPQLVRALRAAGAAGATSLRGVWGYDGDHAPHGDSFWQLERRVPVVTTVVDTTDRIAEWFGVVDRLTDETGLVTSEVVPVVMLRRSSGL